MGRADFLRGTAALIFLGLLASGLYSNTLSNPFVFDDLPFIVYNTRIKDVTDLAAIWQATPVPSRFISYLSFAFDHYWGGGDARAYHITNTIIHVINGWLVFWLMMMLLRTYRCQNLGVGARHAEPLLPLAAALLFISHPIQTEAVTYITQRFASLATLFYVLSVCLFVFARQQQKRWGYMLSAVAGVLAMFTKQIAITLPLMIILTDAVFFKREKGKFPRHWSVILAFFLVIPALYSFQAVTVLTRGATSGSMLGEPITPWTYFLTQSRVILTYFKLLFFPVGQNLLYEFPASQHLLEPETLLSFGALAVIFIFSIFMFKHQPLVAFGLWWFFLALSVESSFIVIRHVIFEHRVYLPSVGFFMALTFFLWYLTRNRWAFGVIAALMIAACSTLTVQRNIVWQSPVSLWEDVVAKSPKILKAKLNLAVAYAEEGRLMDAIKVYDAMINETPSAEALGNRATAYFNMKAYDIAIADYTKALAILPTSARILTGRADAYFKKGDYQAAINDYTAAIAANKDYYMAYNNRANTYRVLEKYALARNDYNEALARNPYLVEGYIGVGAIAFMQGDYAKAVDYFSQALKVDGNNVSALLNRANSYSVLKEFDKAMQDYEKALSFAPENGQIYYNRGILFNVMGQKAQAQEDFERARALGYAPVTVAK